MHVLLIVLGAVAAFLTIVMNDALIRSWAEGRPDMRRVLQTQGLEAIKEGNVRPPAFVAPSITLFVVIALLIWMLLLFLANANGWARLALTALLFFAAGARRTSLTVIGLLQFVAPILQFIIGAWLLQEPMPLERWMGFGLVWLALVILTVDSVVHARRSRTTG